MNEQSTNAVTVVDGFSEDGDPGASPIRGIGIRFKDDGYYDFSDKIDVKGKEYIVLDCRKGWQKLEHGCQPEYLMQKLGEPKPTQPPVNKEDWPENLNGELEHPWKWTNYVYLLDKKTFEILTFWTNTVGGNMAIRNLSDQITFTRQVRPGALPVVTLEMKEFRNRKGGSTERPHFNIIDWKLRDDANPQNLLGGPAQREVEPITTKEALNDEIGF
jgi:hypothetical protein